MVYHIHALVSPTCFSRVLLGRRNNSSRGEFRQDHAAGICSYQAGGSDNLLLNDYWSERPSNSKAKICLKIATMGCQGLLYVNVRVS